MKGTIALCLVAAFLLLAGCTGQPELSTGASTLGNPSTSTSYTLTNNSTSSVFALGQVFTTHAVSYAYGGNMTYWLDTAANLTLQGSEDNSTWKDLASVNGNTSGISFVANSPVLYVRAVVVGWNATAGNATRAALTVKYVGTS